MPLTDVMCESQRYLALFCQRYVAGPAQWSVLSMAAAIAIAGVRQECPAET